MRPILPPAIIIAMLFLSGCVSDGANLIVNQAVVTLPPDQMMTCPLGALPDSFKTNNEVAKTLVKTYANNVKCKHNMDAVRSFLQQEKATVEKK